MKGSNQMHFPVSLEKVTPAMAAALLERNTKNRSLRQANVAKFANDMHRGQWLLNGETIKISATGVVLDGQHRLLAVIRSGATVPMLVVRDLPDEVFSTIDSGKSRSSADVLYVSGVKQASAHASALNLLEALRTRTISNKETISNADVLDVADQYPGLSEFVKVAGRYRNLCLSKTSFVAIHYLAAVVDSEKAAAFFHGVASGADLSETSPVFALRERLLRNASSKAKLPMVEIVALTIKAWNHFYMGNEVRCLRWRNVEPKREPFPEMIGDPFARLSMSRGSRGCVA